MAIKTFDANRVGGGTFQLEQDATTGEYKLKEVGFVKLPELKLPEIDQAAPKAITPSDPTTDTPVDVGGVQTSNEGSGGGDNQQDFTGESMFKNIQEEATKFAGQDTGIVPTRDRTDIDQGAIKVEGLREKEAYDKAVANYNAIAERNRDLGMGRQVLSEEDRIQNKVDLDGARNEMDAAREKFEGTFETIKAAPVISEDLEKFGPRTVTDISQPFRSDSEKFKTRFDPTKIEAAPEKKTTLGSTVKKILDNSLVVNIAKAGTKILDAITPDPTAVDLVNKDSFQTRGELGSSTDPGRIVGNPATDLYAGMNRDSAFGNLEKAGEKRIATREATIARKGIKSASNPNGVSQSFVDNTNNMKDQQNSYKEKLDKKTSTKREAGSVNQPGKGGDQSGRTGGKIVCTMMNESYGFGSFRNKIWLRHSKNLAPEYQIGYHRLFLPLVKKAKTNKFIKIVLEHIAIHRTIDIRKQEKNKIHLLGRVYRTILEPICYLAGKL